jgi:hypothetical protein
VFGEETVRSLIFGLSWLGVIMLLVVIGFETNLGIIAVTRRPPYPSRLEGSSSPWL